MAKQKKETRVLDGQAALVEQATELLDQLDAVLAGLGLVTLSDEDRVHSNGRFRAGESAAISSLLDAMDASPGVFESIADKDGGVDAKKVETAPTRASLARRDLIAPLATRATEMARDLNDDVLSSGSSVRVVSVPAYAILKSNAPINPKLKKDGAAAITFYGHAAKAGAATKKKKKKAP